MRELSKAHTSNRRPRVLIAGDRRRLGHTLDAVVSEAKAHAELSFYSNGPDLLDAVLDGMAQETAPDVLILDDDLSGYGGLNMAASMRRAGYRSAIYVMAPIDRATRIAAAARSLQVQVVQRPVTADAILVAIERARLVGRAGAPARRRDRRQWPRVPVRLVAELRDGHHCSYAGVIADVSLAGMLIEVEVADAGRLRVGRSLEIAFAVEQYTFCVPGVVKRRGDPVGSVELGVHLELADSEHEDRHTFGQWLFRQMEAFLRSRARANHPIELGEPEIAVA